MKAKTEGNTLTVFLEGRIDTLTAPKVEEEIFSIINENASEAKELVIDAKDLLYISSTGLRILMKLKKGTKLPVSIINTADPVYDIFETTGFTTLFDIRKAYREFSVEGLDIIGAGFLGTVYRIDDETIIKVYKGEDAIQRIEDEKKKAKAAFVSGIPTAISYDIVKVGDDYGAVFELLKAKTFNELIESNEEPIEDIVKKYAGLLKDVHSTKIAPGTLPSCRRRYLDQLEVIKKHLSDEEYSGLEKLLTALKEKDNVVHGDIQMKNVMLTAEGPMLIDMDTLSLGDPVFDLAGLFVTYQEFEEDEADNSMNFLGLSNETVDLIWKLIMTNYFDDLTDAERKSQEAKIRLLAAIRFLYIIESSDLKNNELAPIRIKHTKEHIDELLLVVTSLSVERGK